MLAGGRVLQRGSALLPTSRTHPETSGSLGWGQGEAHGQLQVALAEGQQLQARRGAHCRKPWGVPAPFHVPSEYGDKLQHLGGLRLRQA